MKGFLESLSSVDTFRSFLTKTREPSPQRITVIGELHFTCFKKGERNKEDLRNQEYDNS